MTPSAELRPSFEDIFHILAQLPEDKLLKLKLRLKHAAFKPHSKLLQAMVLLTLGQEAAATVCLDALRDERAAQYVRGSRLGAAGDPHPPELDAAAAVLLARIYSLLAEENLCGREAMVRAYERVLEAGGDQEPPESVLAEAREKCGGALGFAGSGSRFQTLRSEPGIARAGGAARSSPVPIGSASEPSGPRTLRSSGSPASFISRFEISATRPAEPRAPAAPQREDPPASPAGSGARRGPVHTSAEAGTSSHAPSATPACSLPPHPPSFCPAAPNLACPPSLHAPCPAAASPSEPHAEQRKFFTFVVLHANSDVDTALRVKELLEGMGVPDGATFCEDFLAGGHGQLSCFQDAMENSAFTILLLTKNFLCQVCMFQTNSALVESILRPSKHNSVIPFVPKENPLGESEIPIFLRGLVPLNENSAVFPSRVRNTFTRSKISEQKALWQQRQQAREQQRRLQLHQEHWQTLRHLSALNLGSLPQAPWPP
ncbi:TCAM1 protein, partial [Nothoprocta ornata]|nr:TCAM1 protein [Nothoprocta ornata]